MIRRLVMTGWAVIVLGGLSAGCTSSNVGDPCSPESIPMGGFNSSEAYVETSSVQCRTRVCLVYGLQGYPPDKCPAGGTCATDGEVADSVYCTCRCGVPEGVNAPTCDCPSGFTCQELVTVAEAGQGVIGSYCVKNPPTTP